MFWIKTSSYIVLSCKPLHFSLAVNLRDDKPMLSLKLFSCGDSKCVWLHRSQQKHVWHRAFQHKTKHQQWYKNNPILNIPLLTCLQTSIIKNARNSSCTHPRQLCWMYPNLPGIIETLGVTDQEMRPINACNNCSVYAQKENSKTYKANK